MGLQVLISQRPRWECFGKAPLLVLLRGEFGDVSLAAMLKEFRVIAHHLHQHSPLYQLLQMRSQGAGHARQGSFVHPACCLGSGQLCSATPDVVVECTTARNMNLLHSAVCCPTLQRVTLHDAD